MVSGDIGVGVLEVAGATDQRPRNTRLVFPLTVRRAAAHRQMGLHVLLAEGVEQAVVALEQLAPAPVLDGVAEVRNKPGNAGRSDRRCPRRAGGLIS